MNKYSKAVKTAATVGMSLAMVLSAVTPVAAANTVATSCSYQKVAQAKDSINGLKELRKDVVGNYGKKGLAYTPKDAIIYDDVDLQTWVDNNFDLLTNLVLCEPTSSEGELATMLVGKKGNFESLTKRVTNLADAINDLLKGFGPDGTYDGLGLTEDDYKVVKPVYDALVKYEAVLTIAQPGSYTEDELTRKDIYDNYFSAIESAVEEYELTFIGDFAEEYAENLLEKEVIKDVTVEELIDGDDFARANLGALESLIESVKDDSDYTRVADEDVVAEIMDELETIVEEIKEVNDLLKTTNPTAKAYREVEAKVARLAATALGYKENDTNEHETSYVKAVAAFSEDDLTKVQEYVEEVYNTFYTVNAVQRSNGNYVYRVEKEEYARYLNTTDKFDADLVTLLTNGFDAADATTFYDELVDGISSVAKLYKAVTEDIDGITLGSKLSDKEAAKIIAANKAYKELEALDFAGLSRKQENAAKANKDLIDALYLKLILNGDVVETGWINKGNGNWDYITEDGKAFTGWVASGSDWFYIQNGSMLRNSWVAKDSKGDVWYYVGANGAMVTNTTIDGCYINSYGAWSK